MALEYQFIFIMNLSRYAPLSDCVSFGVSKSSEELALIEEVNL
jgi:hypothetical protein